mgnify:CR=1 FL=1
MEDLSSLIPQDQKHEEHSERHRGDREEVDGDNVLAPIDALMVINYINDPPMAARPAIVAPASDTSQIVAAIELIFSDDERVKRERK